MTRALTLQERVAVLEEQRQSDRRILEAIQVQNAELLKSLNRYRGLVGLATVLFGAIGSAITVYGKVILEWIRN